VTFAAVAVTAGAASGPTPLPAPSVAPTAAQIAAWKPLPLYDDAVPVLVYHQIGPNTSDGLTISQDDFALQMDMLHRAGFHTISPGAYDGFLHSQTYDLPTRPILITFDDGRTSSFAGADAVLQKDGFQATMFVIAGNVGRPGYLSWDDLRAMQASGRWRMQLHAGYGHVLVATGNGTKGPYYANRRLLAGGKLETLAAFEQRVTQDLNWGERKLEAEIPTVVSNLFSVPFSNYGQDGTNDPAIPAFMKHLLTTRFDAVFLDDRPAWSLPGQAHGVVQRYALHSQTGPDRLYLWLRGSQPNVGSRQPGAEGPQPTSLDLEVAPPAPTVRVGGRIVVRAQVRNGGTEDASLVELQDRLPPNVRLVRGSSGCSVDESRTVTCPLGKLAAGRASTVVLVLRAVARGVAVNRLELVDSYRLAVGTSDRVATVTRVLPRRRRG
jgi:uncharacterized repeat protein (TIGR01451 family)